MVYLCRLIDNEQPKNPREGFHWDRYHTMAEIYAWLDEIASQHSDVVQTITYGYSYEVQPLKGVLISHRVRIDLDCMFVK